MDPLTAFLFLIFVSHECAAKSLAQYPTAVTVGPEENVVFSCAVKDDRVERLNLHWHRQREPGEAFQHVAWLGSDGKQHKVSGDYDRFVLTRNTSANNNSFFLTISNVNKTDEGEYYCAVWFLGSPGFIRGNGTWLQVLTKNVSGPSAHLFPPAEDELATGMATICCLVREFYPRFIDVLWSVDGDTISEGVVATPAVEEEGGFYSVSSYLRISAAEWKQHTVFFCIVRHESSNTVLKKIITSK